MAERTVENRRQCPTRTDGVHSLIAHWITPAVCLDRQRHNYHKCFACQYRGLGADAKLAGPPRASTPETTPRAVPVRKATSKKPAKVAPQVR